MAFTSRCLRGLLLALTLSGAAFGVGSSGCDDAYEPPCKVTSRRVLESDPSIGTRPGIALVRVRDRIVASWVVRDVVDAALTPQREVLR